MENGRDCAESSQSSLLSLPDDVIYSILNACDISTLAALCRVCRRLNHLVNQQCVWVWKLRQYSVVRDLRRNKTELRWEETPAREQCRVAHNWKQGRYVDCRLLLHRVLQMPYIFLNADGLWISYKNLIKCYRIRRDGRLQELSGHTLRGHTGDITRYRCHDNITVSAGRDRKVFCFDHETTTQLWKMENCHNSDIHDVDFHQNVVVTGSRDATVKVWSVDIREDGSRSRQLHHTIQSQDRVWSVAVNPAGHSFVTGTTGIDFIPPLRMWDMNGALLANLGGPYRNGAGVLDIQFESPNVLFSCGYDTLVRMWDLRTSHNKCVKRWEEPFDSTVYCVRTDGGNSLLTGTATYGMTRLWDKRMPKSVQMYYAGRTSSPVYSLAFDSSHLFVALDKGINMLDFSVK